MASYTNVPPGRYTFRVQADEGNEAWSQHQAIAFTIVPPFWMTGWFRLLLALAAVGSVVGAVRFASTRKLQRRLQTVEAQAALDRERMRISKDMHDELGAGLTKIALLGELAQRDIGNPDKTDELLKRISSESRSIAGTMDEIVWAVNPKNDTFESLAAYLLQYVEEYLSATEIRLEVQLPEELTDHRISAEVRHNIFLVVKEGLNNIVKHAGATKVCFGARQAGGMLEFTLEDNGVGFSVADVGRFSDGLSNMRKRMDEIGGTFEVESTPRRGTRLKVCFQDEK